MYDWKSMVIAVGSILGVATLPTDFDLPDTSISINEVPAGKTTELGLYLSSEDAHAYLEEHPEALFIDTRDPLEVSVMGHPQGIDAIVPIRVHGNRYVADRNEFALEPNPDFETMWEKIVSEAGVSKTDVIIVTCGNGRRSALAVNALVATGYKNVWHIVDGYDGEEFEDRNGRNLKNAWQLAGLPWSEQTSVPGAALVRLAN